MTGTLAMLQASANLTDEQLVERVVGGETALFEVLMRRHNPAVYRAVRAVVRDETEAEDTMQQAYLSAFSHLRQFRGAARFKTWLLRIAVHEAFARKGHRGRLVLVDPTEPEPSAEESLTMPQPSPEKSAETRELVTLTEQSIDALPEAYRSVLMLREIEGLDTAETGEILGLSEDAVKQRLSRARRMMREWLEARLGTAAKDAFPFPATRCDRVVFGVMARLPGEGGTPGTPG